MGRKKGSKNKVNKEDLQIQLEELQYRYDELSKSTNTYKDRIDKFVDGFILDLTANIKTIGIDKIQQWFSSPDLYMEEIDDLLTYYYIIDGNISQLYDLTYSLPDLTYKIKCYEKLPSYREDIMVIKQALEKDIRHRILTRTLLVQLSHKGTVIGTWLGNKKNPYFHVFDNLNYVFPWGMYKGKMVSVFDLKYVDEYKKEEDKDALFEELSPIVTRAKYEKWKKDTYNEDLRYIVLPPDLTLVARNRLLNTNQRYGLPQGTQAIFDLQHKQKMKELERAIADKIIRAIAVITMNSKDSQDHTINEEVQKQVFSKVKRALQQNSKTNNSGITVIGLPDWAKFEYPDIKNSDKIFDPSKYESVNNDITTGTTISSVLTNGNNGNYASANLNLDMLYSKIGSMLEQIEEIYNQLIVIKLGKAKGKNYYFEYNKQKPLTKKEKLDIYKGLSDKGYTIKPLLDYVGEDFESYIDQSLYEIEELKLREKIIPSLTSNTASGKDLQDNGRPQNEDETNDSTIKSKEKDGNNNPKPSTE